MVAGQTIYSQKIVQKVVNLQQILDVVVSTTSFGAVYRNILIHEGRVVMIIR